MGKKSYFASLRIPVQILSTYLKFKCDKYICNLSIERGRQENLGSSLTSNSNKHDKLQVVVRDTASKCKVDSMEEETWCQPLGPTWPRTLAPVCAYTIHILTNKTCYRYVSHPHRTNYKYLMLIIQHILALTFEMFHFIFFYYPMNINTQTQKIIQFMLHCALLCILKYFILGLNLFLCFRHFYEIYWILFSLIT